MWKLAWDWLVIGAVLYSTVVLPIDIAFFDINCKELQVCAEDGHGTPSLSACAKADADVIYHLRNTGTPLCSGSPHGGLRESRRQHGEAPASPDLRHSPEPALTAAPPRLQREDLALLADYRTYTPSHCKSGALVSVDHFVRPTQPSSRRTRGGAVPKRTA